MHAIPYPNRKVYIVRWKRAFIYQSDISSGVVQGLVYPLFISIFRDLIARTTGVRFPALEYLFAVFSDRRPLWIARQSFCPEDRNFTIFGTNPSLYRSTDVIHKSKTHSVTSLRAHDIWTHGNHAAGVPARRWIPCNLTFATDGKHSPLTEPAFTLFPAELSDQPHCLAEIIKTRTPDTTKIPRTDHPLL